MKKKLKKQSAIKFLKSDSSSQPGAARALERLEREEAGLFLVYENAKTSGDQLDLKLARDAWLKCSESLRKFDLLVEAARRESGEALLKTDVERWLSNFGCCLYWSIHKASEDRIEAWRILTGAFSTFIANYNPKKSAPCLDVPKLFYKAFFEDLAGGNANKVLRSFQEVNLVNEAISLHLENPEQFHAYIVNGLKKIENQPTPQLPS